MTGFYIRLQLLEILVYSVVWSAVYILLSLIKRHETIFSISISMSKIKKCSGQSLLSFDQFSIAVCWQSENYKIWDIFDLECTHYKNCKCLRRVPCEGILCCNVTYYCDRYFVDLTKCSLHVKYIFICCSVFSLWSWHIMTISSQNICLFTSFSSHAKHMYLEKI